MSDIVSGETFIDGQSVNAGRLNTDFSAAIIAPEFVSAKAAISPTTGDYLLVLRTSDASLKKSLISSLLALAGAGTVTSVGLAFSDLFLVTGSPVTSSGTFAATLVAQIGNRVFAGPINGGTGIPAFRALVPADNAIPSVAIAASNIDWSLSNTFYKGIVGNSTFTFSNLADGRSITVRIQNNGLFTVAWPGTVKWPSPSYTQPAQGLGVDIWKFDDINGVIYGTHNAYTL